MKNIKIPYSKTISRKIKKGISSGLSVRQIFGSISKMANAPQSLQTFYNLYREDMDEYRADIAGQVGKKVVDQALDGDFKSQEFFLRSRHGWSPQSTVTEVEADSADEDELTAVDALMAALGKLED